MHAQTFEPVSFSQRSSGVASWGADQVVVFGTGLTWLDRSGKIQDQKRIIEGIPSSDFKDAVSDGQGGLWLMTNNTVSRLSNDKQATVIIDEETSAGKELQELHMSAFTGEVYCLGKNEVFKLNDDNSFTTLFESEESKYFKHFSVAKDGSIYISSYKEIYTLKPGGQLIPTALDKKNYNFQSVHCTTDDRVIILDYRDIYEFKDGGLVDFIKGSQISRGLKLYTGSFKSSNDFWLYANEGNAFHNDNGQWVNYIPPEGLKTGNFGEHMHETSDGHIWMTLRGHTILHFDGQKWNEVNLDKEQTIIKILRAQLVDSTTLVSGESKTNVPYTFKGGELAHFTKLPSRRFNGIQQVGNAIYYSDENGLYKKSSGKESRLVEGKINGFVVYKDEIIYSLDDKIWSLKNGQITEFKDNVHFLGWEKLGSIKFVLSPDNKVIAKASKRGQILATYDGQTWGKLIRSGDYGFGQIKHLENSSHDLYVSNDKEDVFLYDNGEFRKIYNNEEDVRYSSARLIPSSDNTIWFIRKGDIIVFKEGNIVAEFSMPTSNKMGGINAIVPVSEKTYNIFGSSEIVKCTLP